MNKIQYSFNRDCPSCRASTSKNIVIATDRKPYNCGDEDVRNMWSGFYKEKVLFDHVECKNCGLIYSKDYFQETSLMPLYASMAPNMDMVPEALLKKTQQNYMDVFNRNYTVEEGAYFELGADVGYIVEEAAKHTKFGKFYIVEPNIDVHQQLKNKLYKHDHRIYKSVDGLDEIEDESLSLVVMIHVLDHLLEPRSILHKIYSKLKVDGKILIVTHDQSSLMAKILKNKWPAYCLQHPHLFSPRTIKKMANISGYSKCTVIKSKNYFTIGFLIEQLFWIAKIKISLRNGIFGRSIGLKLGNILTVVTK